MAEAKETNKDTEIEEDVAMKMPEEPFGQPEKEEQPPTALGPVIGILIIVLVLILAGLFIWQRMMVSTEMIETVPVPPVNNEPETTNTAADVQALGVMSSSDELDAIEADIESTNLETLDSEIQAIESEVQNAAQ